MEVFFFTGLIVAVFASHLCIPREQHDARGVTILACIAAALSIGWVATRIGLSDPFAWSIAPAGTLAVARIAVRCARQFASRRPPTIMDAPSGNRQLTSS